MQVDLSLNCWEQVLSYISPSRRYKSDLYTVCKTFHKALKNIGLSVSIDIVFHPEKFNSTEGSTASTTADLKAKVLHIHSIKCLIAPPPNPFRYPPKHPFCGSVGHDKSHIWQCCDVHCVVEVRSKDLVEFVQTTDTAISATPKLGRNSIFSEALRHAVHINLGNTSISCCITKCQDYFPLYAEIDLCAHAGRLPKSGVYARKSAATGNNEERKYITHASLVVSSVPCLESMLLPLSGVQSLSVMLDVPSTMRSAAFITSYCEPTSLTTLEYLSIGYYDDNVVPYSSKHNLSVQFFTSIIKRVQSLKHLTIEKVANKQHIAPLLRAALSQKVHTLSLPLEDMSGYLQLMSTQEDLFKAMLSSIRSIVISGYSQELMTVQYLSHLIRFFSHITSLRCLIFDMGGEYNDDNEVVEMNSIVEAAKMSTVDARAATTLDIFLDFE